MATMKLLAHASSYHAFGNLFLPLPRGLPNERDESETYLII